MPCVENTLSVSSTRIISLVFCSQFMLIQGMMPATTPMMMAPQPFT